MDLTSKVNRLLAEFAGRIGLPSLSLDEEGMASLLFDEQVGVTLLLLAGRGVLSPARQLQPPLAPFRSAFRLRRADRQGPVVCADSRSATDPRMLRGDPGQPARPRRVLATPAAVRQRSRGGRCGRHEGLSGPMKIESISPVQPSQDAGAETVGHFEGRSVTRAAVRGDDRSSVAGLARWLARNVAGDPRSEQALQRLADGDGTPLEARTVRRR